MSCVGGPRTGTLHVITLRPYGRGRRACPGSARARTPNLSMNTWSGRTKSSTPSESTVVEITDHASRQGPRGRSGARVRRLTREPCDFTLPVAPYDSCIGSRRHLHVSAYAALMAALPGSLAPYTTLPGGLAPYTTLHCSLAPYSRLMPSRSSAICSALSHLYAAWNPNGSLA